MLLTIGRDCATSQCSLQFSPWDAVSTTPPQKLRTSTCHVGSSGVLIMLVSIVVPEKQPGQKRCDEEKEDNF